MLSAITNALFVTQITIVKREGLRSIRDVKACGCVAAGSRAKRPKQELGEECSEGTAAMAEGELGLEVDLGHGFVELGQVEEGIVAEAAGASRCVRKIIPSTVPSALFVGLPSRAATSTQW